MADLHVDTIAAHLGGARDEVALAPHVDHIDREAIKSLLWTLSSLDAIGREFEDVEPAGLDRRITRAGGRVKGASVVLPFPGSDVEVPR
ncbi:hypothetical protein Rctr16k_09 [Virus Rctr16k]|nr:hypothetical protein Rctr16k_09 [Virus Rctr16k]